MSVVDEDERGTGSEAAEPDRPLAMRSHGTNMVGVPTNILSAVAFNERPRACRIHGTRGTHGILFEALDGVPHPDAAAEVFQYYMSRTFGLNPDFSGTEGADGKRRFRASYLRLLKGWMFDSNNAEGAVLKGWVESRFGLLPTWHKEPLVRFTSEAWQRYGEQKFSTRFHNNHIHLQLDLLYEFCQWWIRRGWPDAPMPAWARSIKLYRGINDFDESYVIERQDKRNAVLRLNNLCSFSSDRDIAGQFGDYILEAWVPVAKIIFFRDVLPCYPFAGEGEYLVVGGDYRVVMSFL
jgi:NAD+--dinitrogen-reductase ADP-D-ribosyltransferase